MPAGIYGSAVTGFDDSADRLLRKTAARMHGGTIGAGRQIGLRDGGDGCHENGSDPSWLELAELSATISKSSDFAAQDLNLD